jgi:uncharacterized metal-binding protein YceD (DUF177 family)
MKIHLRQIPAGGLHLEGEEDCPLDDLEAQDARCTGPLRYSLDVGMSGDDLWASGTLTQPLEFRCVRCLEPFPYDLTLDAFALHAEANGPETIDLTPFMREDLLLNLPAYPHCDREGGRVCPAAGKIEAAAQTPVVAEPDWSALDKLKL